MLASEVVAILNGYRERRKPISFDLEGQCNWISCYSIADSPDKAVVVPFIRADGSSFWSEEDEVAIWEATERLLSDPDVPKILQNFLYDGFVLAWSYGILIRGLWVDTMLGHFELHCELEKSLGFQASIYTKEPFYKAERKSTNEMTQLIYCGKDACVTYECWLEIDKRLMPKQREHFQTNIQLLTPLLFMELRGIKFDETEAKRRLDATQKRIASLQDRINREAAASRPALQAFFDATANSRRDAVLRSSVGAGVAVEHGSGGVGEAQPVDTIISILATAFCVADPAEWRDVTEHYYEPQRWNGKKWCKGGKRIGAQQHEAIEAALKAGAWQGSQPPSLTPTDKGATWLKPASKVVNRRCKVEVATFEDVRRFAKDSCKDACRRACAILRAQHEGASGSLTPAQRGELATLLGVSIKLNASGRKKDKVGDDGTVERGDEKDANWLLYDCWGLPKQFTRERGRKLTDKLSSDMEALLTIWSKTKDRRALWFLAWRSLDTRRETLEAKCDADGRIRCGYNIVGTETCRLSCYESPTGSGYNLQTVADRDKDLFVADEGCEFGSVDLRGADSWSVAARAAMQGDSRMLDDLRAGRKIQTIVALCYQRGADVINKLAASQLDELCRQFDEKQFIYKGCKMVVYGSSYGMGAPTMSAQLLTRSYKDEGKPVWVEPKLCKAIQDKAFFVRYWGVPLWQQESLRKLKETGSFTTCAGHRRLFYGRKDDHKTLGEYLCEEAQFNTTYATKLGLLKMWTDPENRRADGSLRVEPLHSVHDSLNLQWRVEDREFARAKILPVWFNNNIYVGTIKLVIPASGSYGANWKDCDTKL